MARNAIVPSDGAGRELKTRGNAQYCARFPS